MSKDRTKKGLLRKGVCCVSVLAMASLMVVPVASAADGDDTDITWTAPKVEKTLGTYITTGVHRAAEPTAEIIGVSDTSINSQSGFVAVGTTLAEAEKDTKLGVYGSPANCNANPYIWNYFYNFYAAENGLSASTNVFHFSTTTSGPNAAMTGIESEYGTSADLSWRPDMLIGISGNASEYSDEQGLSEARNWQGYHDLILQIRSWTDDVDGGIPSDADSSGYTFDEGTQTYTNADGNEVVYSEHYMTGDWDYSPQGIDYQSNTFYNFVDTIYATAQAAQDVKDLDSNRTTRYGDPLSIAYKFEMYGKATKWAVYQGLEKDGKDLDKGRKTVAYVSSVNTTDKTANLTKMTPDGELESSNIGRYLQGIEDTSIDLAASGEETQDSGSGGGGRGGSETAYKVTAEQLKTADVIFTTSVEDVEEMLGEEYTGTIYNQNVPAGTYGLTVNSIESVLLVGLAQGLIYPEYINPVAMVCYYFDEFYHLTADSLQDALTLNCTVGSNNVGLPDGLTWSADEYNYETIQSMLDSATEWYYNNEASTDPDAVKISTLRPTTASTEAMNTAYAAGTLFDAVDPNADEGISGNPVSIEDLQKQLEQVQQDLEQAKDDLADAEKQAADAESDLAAAEKRAEDAEGQLADAEKQAEEAQKQVAEAEQKVADLEKENADLQQKINAGGGSSTSTLKAQTIKTTTYKAYKAKKVKKKKQSFNVAKASGKITVKKGKGSKKLKVSKTGKVTVKKGLKKGNYTINVTISAAGTSTYAPASTTATVTVAVK